MRTGWRCKRLASALATACVLLLMAAPARAGIIEDTAHPVRKLGRGLANTLTGVLEIPLTIQSVDATHGPVAAMSLGLLTGVGAAITRTLIGLAEVVTFPFPLSKTGYAPILQPEFLLQPDTGHSSIASQGRLR